MASITWFERKEMVKGWLAENGGKYIIDPNYDGSEYKNASCKVGLLCPEHGSFSARPQHIKAGRGCPSCAGVTPQPAHAVITRIKDADSRYTFIGFENGRYKNKYTKVTRNCPEHGSFSTAVHAVLTNKAGCPVCAPRGYDNNKTGFLYGLLSACGKYLKIGITNKLEQRLRQLKSATPFEFHVLNVYKDVNGTRCRMLEGYFHKTHESAGLSGFDGATEWMA